MLARDHALSGAAAFAAAAPALHATGPVALAAGAAFTAGAATLPDIDEPGSTIARTLGFFTGNAARVVHAVSGGHRKATHSILGVTVFTAAAWAATRAATGLPGKIALAVVLSVVLAAGARALRLGGHHGDLLGMTAAAAATYWHAGLTLVPACIALGAAAHIAGDELTHGGCPLLYPASGREFNLLPGPLRITTGRFAEHWIISVLLGAALCWLIARDSGLAALARHLSATR